MKDRTHRSIEAILKLKQEAVRRALSSARLAEREALGEGRKAEAALERALGAHQDALTATFDPWLARSWASEAHLRAGAVDAAAAEVRTAAAAIMQTSRMLTLAHARSGAAQARIALVESAARRRAEAGSDDDAVERHRLMGRPS